MVIEALMYGGTSLLASLESVLAQEPATWSVLGLGFVLGLRHALDLDHVVAVSTIVSQHRSLARSSLIGAFWGIGHTASLLLVGMLVIGLRWSVPERLVLGLELLVAFMLIGLGIDVVRKALQIEVHQHLHDHAEREKGAEVPSDHAHLHVHVGGSQRHQHGHLFEHARRPLLVGMVHGLAGSAALALLVMTTIATPWLGALYMLVFGVGSIGGMVLMSSAIGLPMAWSVRRMGGLHRGVQLAAGAFSVAFGLFLAYEIGFVEGLFL